jgi:hypothetical protein
MKMYNKIPPRLHEGAMGVFFTYFAAEADSSLRMRIALALRRFANPSTRLMAKAALALFREM